MMEKYLEEKEDNQWDDDFIFDAPATSRRRRVVSNAPAAAEHSFHSFGSHNHKRKPASNTWNAAFKQIEADPRHGVVSVATTKTTAAQSSTSTATTTTATAVYSHGSAPPDAHTEFAFFDSEDRIGFHKTPPRAFYSAESNGHVHAASSGSRDKGDKDQIFVSNPTVRSRQSEPSGGSFDDGLGEQNLGFGDDDFIPNVGFDEDEIYDPAVSSGVSGRGAAATTTVTVAQQPHPVSANASTISSWQNSSLQSTSDSGGSVRKLSHSSDQERPNHHVRTTPSPRSGSHLQVPSQYHFLSPASLAHPASVIDQGLKEQELNAMLEDDRPLSFDAFHSIGHAGQNQIAPPSHVSANLLREISRSQSQDRRNGDDATSARIRIVANSSGTHRPAADVSNSSYSTPPHAVNAALAKQSSFGSGKRPTDRNLQKGRPERQSKLDCELSPGLSVKECIRRFEKREYLSRNDSDNSYMEAKVPTYDAEVQIYDKNNNDAKDDCNNQRMISDSQSVDSRSSVGHKISGSSMTPDERSGDDDGDRDEEDSNSYYDHSDSNSEGEGSSQYSEYFSDDSTEEDEEEEDDDDQDWDLDLEPSSSALKQATTKSFRDILTGRGAGFEAGDADSVGEGGADSQQESLLQYLTRTINSVVYPPTSTSTEMKSLSQSRDIFEKQQAADGSSLSLISHDHSLEGYEEEGHTVETANPHLRGLLNWVDATTQSLHAVLNSSNSNKEKNARIYLKSEIEHPSGGIDHIDRVLDSAEQMPASSGKCIAALEEASKWLRAVCNFHDDIAGSLQVAPVTEDGFDKGALHTFSSGNNKIRRTCSLGESRLSAVNSTSSCKEDSKNDRLRFGDLSGGRIDRVYDVCDHILQEQLINTSTSLGTNYRKLLAINSKSSLYPSNSAKQQQQQQSSVWRGSSQAGAIAGSGKWLTEMGMVAVRDNSVNQNQNSLLRCISAPSDDDQLVAETVRLSAILISLYRLQINMLEIRIHMYDSFELVACLELLQKISEELEKVTSTLFAALRRVLPHPDRSSLEKAAQREHLDTLSAVAQDLVGCCYTIKVLAICNISPISFRPLPDSCQHIAKGLADPGRFSSYDAFSFSDDNSSNNNNNNHHNTNNNINNNMPGSSGTTQEGGVASAQRSYNVIYELTLGSHFLELMVSLPSPSVVRSKLYLSTCMYLQKLKKKLLPWQTHRYKLVSLKQNLDSFANIFNLYHGADAFGLNYSDLDNNSFTLSLVEVEASITQSFAEVFGSLDQGRIIQLLLFESSVELLPTSLRDDITGPAALLQPRLDAQQFFQQQQQQRLSNSKAVRLWEVFSDINDSFHHLPPALNLDKTLQLDRALWEASYESPVSVYSSTGVRRSVHPSPMSTDQCSSASPKLDPSQGQCQTASPKLIGINTLSYSCRYELFSLSSLLLYRLAQATAEMSPNVALDIYQLCILSLAHLHHKHERARVEKIAVMLAVKVGRRDAAIWHGEAVLSYLQMRGDDISEMLYLTDLLASQYSENAQYELAAKALFGAINALNLSRERGRSLSAGRDSAKHSSLSRMYSPRALAISQDSVAASTDLERTLDPLILKLGRLLLNFGCPERAADAFQVLLSSLCERTDCLANDAKKVTVLSWLAEVYLELEQFGACAHIIRTIKAVRGLKLHKATNVAIKSSPSKLEPRVSLRSKISKKRSPQSFFASSSHSPNLSNDVLLDSNNLMSKTPQPQQRISKPSTPVGEVSSPPPPRQQQQQQNELVGGGDHLRSRPLPPVPPERTTCTDHNGEKNLERIPRHSLHHRPLPPTPLELNVIEGEDCGSVVSSTRLSLKTNEPQQCEEKSIGIGIAVPEPSPEASSVPALLILPSHPAPAPAQGRAVSVNLLEKRQQKGRILNNLQPLNISNNTITSAGDEVMITSTPNLGLETDRSFGTVKTNSPRRPVSTKVQNLFLHYLRNPPEANLPKFCSTAEDFDLGLLRAKLMWRNKKFVAALRSLLPTVLAVESCVFSIDSAPGTCPEQLGNRAALIELGQLYYMYGEIALEAARSAHVSYPFQVGTKEVFDRVVAVMASNSCCPQDSSASADVGTQQAKNEQRRLGKRFLQNRHRIRVQQGNRSTCGCSGGPAAPTAESKPEKSSKPVGSAASRKLFHGVSPVPRTPRIFALPVELCWDAVKWFTRAKDIAKLAGDEIGGAMAASAIARCNLQQLFVPQALLKIPADRVTEVLAPDSKGRAKSRKASLREVQNNLHWALEIHSHTCLPIPLMDGYLSLAEMNHLQGNLSLATLFWKEARDLFVLLFGDGVLVPIARRGSIQSILQIQAILDRIVRFMWTLNKPIIDAGIFLLDSQILLGYEIERIRERNREKAGAVSSLLDGALYRLIQKQSVTPKSQVAADQSAVGEQKKKSKSALARLSRFFTRLFSSSSSEPYSEASAQKKSKKNSLSLKSHSSRGNKISASACFDSFIERNGFRVDLDMRLFYNIMNDGLVAEKVYDFGWSNLVDYESFLQEMLNSSALERVQNNSENLLRLNEWSKIHFALKYKKLFVAQRNWKNLPVQPNIQCKQQQQSENKEEQCSPLHCSADAATEPFEDDVPPLDPYVDFDWMDESFSDYSPYGRYLQNRTLSERTNGRTDSRSKKLRMDVLGSTNAQFPVIFMPEFDEAHDPISTDSCVSGSRGGGGGQMGGGGSASSYLEDLDRRGEIVLIQRAWRCYLLLQSAPLAYQSGRVSIEHVRRDVRSSLCSLGLHMVRLRAFSRQFRPSLVTNDSSESTAPAGSSPSPSPLLLDSSLSISKDQLNTLQRNDYVPVSPRNENIENIDSSALIYPDICSFQFMVYAIYVDEILMMYRPSDGTRSVQYLGCLTPLEPQQKGKGISELTENKLASPNLRSNSSLYQQAFGKNTPRAADKRPPLRPGLTPKSSFISVASGKSSTDGDRSLRSLLPDKPKLNRSSSKFLRSQGLSRKLSGTSSLMSASVDLEEEGGLNTNRSSSGPILVNINSESADGSEVFGCMSTSEKVVSSKPSKTHINANNANTAVDALNCSSASISVVTMNPRDTNPSTAAAAAAAETNASSAVRKTFLSAKESKFLFELSVASKDKDCGGGKVGRKGLIADLQLATSALHSSVDFISRFVAACCPLSQQHAQQRQLAGCHEEDSKNQVELLPSAVVGIVTNRPASVLPWEILLPESIAVVRHMVMTVMCAEMLTSRVQSATDRSIDEMHLKPVFVTVPRCVSPQEARILSESRVLRRSNATVAALCGMNQSTAHLPNIQRQVANNTSALPSEFSNINRMDWVATLAPANSFQSTSPSSTSMVRDYEVVSLQASLYQQQQQQVVAVAAPTAAQIWRSVSNCRGEGMQVFSCVEFPLFVMSYGDHLDLPDFAAYATSYFHGGVVVLAPMFLQEQLAVALKKGFEINRNSTNSGAHRGAGAEQSSYYRRSKTASALSSFQKKRTADNLSPSSPSSVSTAAASAMSRASSMASSSAATTSFGTSGVAAAGASAIGAAGAGSVECSAFWARSVILREIRTFQQEHQVPIPVFM